MLAPTRIEGSTGTVAQTVLAVLGLGGNALVIAMQPAALMFMTAFYASLYANYADTFEAD